MPLRRVRSARRPVKTSAPTPISNDVAGSGTDLTEVRSPLTKEDVPSGHIPFDEAHNIIVKPPDTGVVGTAEGSVLLANGAAVGQNAPKSK